MKVTVIELSAETHDFLFTDAGSLVLMRPRTEAAVAWVDEHISEDAQWFAGAVVIEPRFVSAILHGIESDGLTVGVV